MESIDLGRSVPQDIITSFRHTPFYKEPRLYTGLSYFWYGGVKYKLGDFVQLTDKTFVRIQVIMYKSLPYDQIVDLKDVDELALPQTICSLKFTARKFKHIPSIPKQLICTDEVTVLEPKHILKLVEVVSKKDYDKLLRNAKIGHYWVEHRETKDKNRVPWQPQKVVWTYAELEAG